MIQFVTGTLGAGKTFHSVRLMMEHMAAGLTCVTNVDINWEPFRSAVARKWGVWIEPEQLRRFDPDTESSWEESIPWGGGVHGETVHVVMDETHLFYNARDWAQTAENNKRLLSFLTQSRKAAVDVTWITQEGGNVDKQFRQIAEWELNITNVKHLPLGVLGALPFNAYVVKRISNRGGYLVGKKWHAYDSWIKGTYKTEALLNQQMRDLSDKAERCGAVQLRKVSLWEKLKLNASVHGQALAKQLKLNPAKS